MGKRWFQYSKGARRVMGWRVTVHSASTTTHRSVLWLMVYVDLSIPATLALHLVCSRRYIGRRLIRSILRWRCRGEGVTVVLQ